jgi:hypothetical protein
MLWRNASTEHFEEADSVADRPYRTLSNYDSSSVAQSPIRNWRLVIAKKYKSLVANPETGEFRDEGVPVVVPATFYLRLGAHCLPGSLERGHVTGWVGWRRLTPREDIPVVRRRSEPLQVPDAMVDESLVELRVHRNDTPLPSIALRAPDLNGLRGEVHPSPGQRLDLGVPESAVASEHEGGVHVRTLGQPRPFDQALCLFAIECLTDMSADSQLQLLLFPETGADQLAWIAQHLEEEANLLIDSFGSRLLPEPTLLIAQDRTLIDVNDELRPKEAGDMTQCMLCKRRRPVAEPIADQIFVDDVLEASNPLLTDVLDAVVASFQFSPPFFLCFLCDRLRGGLRRFPDQLPREIELVPPDSASFERCHVPLPRLREAHRCFGRDWRLQ